MSKRTVIGVLGAERHGSVGHLFRTIADELSRDCEVLSTWFDPAPTPALLSEIANRCDVVVGRIERIEHLREELQRPLPGVYVPLGELPLLSSWIVQNAAMLRPYDTIAFSCRADRAIFDSLVAGCPAKRTMLPFFADIDRMTPLEPAAREAARLRLGYGPDDVVFLYVGRMYADKNVQTILRVMQYVPGARLLLVGLRADWGTVFERPRYDMADMIPRLIDHFELRDRVAILDPVPHDQLVELYGAADVLVNLTLHETENFGFTQVEAAACGLPVIGTRWGGLKDTIEHAVTGLAIDTWVTPWGIHADVGQAVQAFRELAASRQRRIELGVAGQARARSRFSLATFMQTLRAELEDCRRRGAEVVDGGSSTVATALGRRIARRTTKFTRRTHASFALGIAPYASRVAEPGVTSGQRFFVAPLSVKLGPIVEAVDLLWPGRYRLGAAARRVLARAIEGARITPTVRGSTIANTAADLRGLAELVERGLLVRSTPLPHARQDIEPVRKTSSTRR